MEDINPIQQALKEMNSGGAPNPAPNPNPNPDPNPNPNPAPNPAATPKPTEDPKPVNTPTQGNNKPADPQFIKKSESQKQPAPGNQPAPNNQPAPDEVVFNRLSEWTGGSITSKEAFVNLINDYNSLVEQAEKGFEPKFSDERAKWAYQVLSKSQGAELETAMRTLRTLRFNAEGKSAKDLLFEKYLLDPNNSDLTEANAGQYFEADFEEKYSLIGKSDDELTQDQIRQKRLQERNLASAEREAKEYFKKQHEEFKAMDSEPAKISEDVMNGIGNAVNDFGGVRLSFSENAAENELLNLAVDNPQELEELHQDALSPNDWWSKFIGQFDLSSQEGYNAFVREFYLMKNHEKVRKETFDHGVKIGKLQAAKEARNSSDPKDLNNFRGPIKEESGNFFDAWGNAKNGR